MIIQAGFDLQILARPLIVQEVELLPRLVVVGLDAEMQLDSIEVVTDAFEGSLAPFQEAILESLDPEAAKYFANCPPRSVERIQLLRSHSRRGTNAENGGG